MKYIICFLIFLMSGFVLFAQKKVCDTIPFKNDLGLIIIPVQFNGNEKNFVFDTGATHSIGFSWVQEELKKTRKTAQAISSSTSKSKLRFYKSDSVQLASAKIKKHQILSTNDNDIFSCYYIDGILGMDIISNFNWLINYKDQYLVMYTSEFSPDAIDQNMYALDFSYENKIPSVFFNINNKRIKFLLDTGATDSDINTNHSEAIGAAGEKEKEVHGMFFDFNGVLNKTKSSVVKFSEIQSKSFVTKPIFSLTKNSSKIGNSLWQGNILFLSLKNNKLYSSSPDIDELRIHYGSSFIFDKGKIITAKVVVGSEAWKKGLRQGTEVLTVNGKEFDDFCTVYKYQKEMFLMEKELIVTLKDGKTITIHKKPLF